MAPHQREPLPSPRPPTESLGGMTIEWTSPKCVRKRLRLEARSAGGFHQSLQVLRDECWRTEERGVVADVDLQVDSELVDRFVVTDPEA